MRRLAIRGFCNAHNRYPDLTEGIVGRVVQLFSSSSASDTQAVTMHPILLGVGLLVIANIHTLARRTVWQGGTSFWDVLLICAGIHNDQEASRLSEGEYPACAAMTTGYVFRIENEAMVYFLQRCGLPGQLTTVHVHAGRRSDNLPSMIQVVGLSLTMVTIAFLLSLQDWYAMLTLAVYIVVRSINSIIIMSRAQEGWKGAKEPGVKSDLLVLLSQDRWIRVQGLTDDVKAVTSGQWLRPLTPVERLLTISTTLVLYLCVGLVACASITGAVALLSLICVTTIMLEANNELSSHLKLYGRTLNLVARKRYDRRLEMAKQLIQETGRDDWCEKMGIVLSNTTAVKSSGPAHM